MRRYNMIRKHDTNMFYVNILTIFNLHIFLPCICLYMYFDNFYQALF